jgi:hypothetical protein
METALVTAAISAVTAVVVLVLGNFYSRRREHEADWRRMKLDRYREYVVALSGTIVERVTRESHLRYSDAVNALLLVAPANVLQALDSFLEHTSFRNPHQGIERHNLLLGELIRTMRRDLQPGKVGGDDGLHFRLLGVPPADWTPVNSAGDLKAAELSPEADRLDRSG